MRPPSWPPLRPQRRCPVNLDPAARMPSERLPRSGRNGCPGHRNGCPSAVGTAAQVRPERLPESRRNTHLRRSGDGEECEEGDQPSFPRVGHPSGNNLFPLDTAHPRAPPVPARRCSAPGESSATDVAASVRTTTVAPLDPGTAAPAPPLAPRDASSPRAQRAGGVDVGPAHPHRGPRRALPERQRHREGPRGRRLRGSTPRRLRRGGGHACGRPARWRSCNDVIQPGPLAEEEHLVPGTRNDLTAVLGRCASTRPLPAAGRRRGPLFYVGALHSSPDAAGGLRRRRTKWPRSGSPRSEIHELGRAVDAAMQALAAGVTAGPVTTSLATLTWAENVFFAHGGPLDYNALIAPIPHQVVPQVAQPAAARPLDQQPAVRRGTTAGARGLHLPRDHGCDHERVEGTRPCSASRGRSRGRVPGCRILRAEQRSRWLELRWRDEREAAGQAIVPDNAEAAVAQNR